MLKKNDIPEIQKAVETLNTINEDDELWVLAWAQEKAERDYISGMRDAERKGYEKGYEKGLAEGIAESRAEGIAKGRAEGIAEGKAEGKAKGIAEGKVEGAEKKSVEIAISLLKQGQLSIEVISSVTGLSIEKLQELQKIN